MRVTYNQTPPPVVADEAGMVTVTPQLEQVEIIYFNGLRKFRSIQFVFLVEYHWIQWIRKGMCKIDGVST